ncbi:thiopeptide-type bacteriocin biosynthesis protein [Amycolatopsis decaplanina]|uniref:Thiopeptide-type bacteriocin biosynthesis domain-containing protein n=1 Tax=Amycolatopsis decaplanina DSM 44594 TaxID=1284240 RepID=M2WUU3_9PSEU|nr:thiopeptide-type bacteriocin biosynthesis protein [Amycolatopsis decaplanina]EME52536.1 hypothetical protein H074_33554 [Amycolatopsis decaplanina DSM 44594]
MNGYEWWYARLYPGAVSGMDTVAAGASRWAKRTAGEIDARCWYFIRYLDATGVHIRLRIQADPDALDTLDERSGPLRELVATTDRPPAPEHRRLIPEAGALDTPGPSGVRLGCYEPEIDKYGRDHLPDAETAFQDSSELMLDLDATSKAQPGARAGLAARLMREAAAAVLTEAEIREFWPFHRNYWGEHLRLLRQSKAALQKRLDTVVTTIGNHPPTETEIDLLRAWSDRLARRIHATAPSRRSRLFFHHLHMSMNRLGYLPAEEAMIGLAMIGGGK